MGNLKPINWENYEKNIHTPNVVQKIKATYEDFNEAEFLIDGAVAKTGSRSEAMKSLDVSMHYNYNLWYVHYMTHL